MLFKINCYYICQGALAKQVSASSLYIVSTMQIKNFVFLECIIDTGLMFDIKVN